MIIYSCATDKFVKNTPVFNYHSIENFSLPGIDSSVARNAIQLSDQMIVNFNRRNEAKFWYDKGLNSFQIADSLWRIFQEKPGQDSITVHIYTTWRQEHDTVFQLIKIANEFNFNKLKEICQLILSTGEYEVNQAKHFNPFDLDIRSLLIKILMKLGEITQDTVYFAQSIEELNNFLLVDKSNPYIYEKLAECYYALNEWAQCYRYFHEAEVVLKIVSGFKYENNNMVYSSIDTMRWVYYLRGQGEAKARLYDSEKAIYYLTKGIELNNSIETKKQLQDYIDWINWDGGNIRAAEFRDEILKLENLGDYKKARSGYLDLYRVLKTQKAKSEINWKIASIEFNCLGKKKEAINRLFQTIQNIQKKNYSYSLNTVYLKDYAAMCYSLGLEYFNQNKYRLSYIYLNQASKFNWEHKAESYFYLAVLSHQNPEETILNCEKALACSDQLTEKLTEKVYEMLAVSYRRKGEFEIAQKYYDNLSSNEQFIEN